jgi:hypothetical protein
LGQQQLLLIIVAIIVIGVAIAVSIQLFRSNAIDRKRELVMNESANLASIAISYYKKPKQMGGGGKEFTGWQVPSTMTHTTNGSYVADVTATQVIITATGTEVVTGTDSIKVETYVNADDYYTVIIH